MKTPVRVIAIVACLFFPWSLATALRGAETPSAPPNPNAGAATESAPPTGKLIGPLAWRGKSYPDTVRQYWLYVPAQYRPTSPAPVMIFLHGQHYVQADGPMRAPTVLDQLIGRREMPATLALFLTAGTPEGEPPRNATAADLLASADEFTAPDDQYVRFLIEEFIPGALKGYNVTKNAAGHAIAGAGPAGAAAFTAGWIRPDYFQKIMSHVGNFEPGRRGRDYPDKIRAAARKPLRIVLQNIPANRGEEDRLHEQIVGALAEKNYDHRNDLGRSEGSTSTLGPAGDRFSDELRWLWRDYRSDPPDFAELAAQAPSDAAFGTPGTRWEVTFEGMSSPVTYEFRANGILYWVEYQVSDNYEFRDGQLITTSSADPAGRYRWWQIKDNTFARVIHNTGPDVELGLTARGTFKRVP